MNTRRIIALIVNPNAKSGKGLETWEKLRMALEARDMHQDRQYTVTFTAGAGYATEVTSELTQLDEVVNGDLTLILGVIGGDGTLNEVLNGIKCFEHTKVAYIPAGSGNDFARATGCGHDIEEMADMLAEKIPPAAVYDYGRMQITSPLRQVRRFVVSAGMGYDANVCQAIRKSTIKDVFNHFGLGKIAYSVLGLIEVLRCKPVDGWLELDDIERVNFKKMWFVSVHEQPFEGGGYRFAPAAEADDGLLDVCLMSDMSRARFVTTLLFGYLFKIEKMQRPAKHFRAEKVKLHVNRPRQVHCDGEMMGLQRNVAFKGGSKAKFAVVKQEVSED